MADAGGRPQGPIPARQDGVAGAFKQKLQRRRFNVDVAKDYFGLAGEMKIAQPFMAGFDDAKKTSPGRDERNSGGASVLASRSKDNFLSSHTGLKVAPREHPRLKPWAIFRKPAGSFTATIFRAAADGLDSNGSKLCRWRLQIGISASAIRRGRRKRPRWLCRRDENSPAIHGWARRCEENKSRQGRQNTSFVPAGTLENFQPKTHG